MIYICNHPWPYYGNINGDGFARPLDSIGDYYKLWIHAIHDDNTEDSVVVNLAINTNGRLLQSPNWQYVNLAKLKENVKLIYFTLESSDQLIIRNTNYGPNTAVYFCMDKLEVFKTGKTASNSSLRKAHSSNSTNAIVVSDYFPASSYSGGIVTIYNSEKKEVYKTTIKSNDRINLENLTEGEYLLQHGNKIIPIIKKGETK